MRSLKLMVCMCSIFLTIVSIVGCGEVDPNANVPPEKEALAPENLGDNPEYAEQMNNQMNNQ